MMLQDRERVVLETLQRIPTADAVLIGGYAVNAYVPPRFSIDCDLVLLGDPSVVEDALRAEGFAKAEQGDVPYGSYVRYDKKEDAVSFDLLIHAVHDRDSGVVFEADVVARLSRVRTTVGRVNPIRIQLRIADPELLFAMKFVAARRGDVRDLFMLAGHDLEWDVASQLLRKKCAPGLLEKRAAAIRTMVTSGHYRDSLQGAYGKMPDERYATCRTRLQAFLERVPGPG